MLMIPTTDEAADTALAAINCLDVKNQEKGSVSNTTNIKYLKERRLCKYDDDFRGKKEAMK